MLTTFVDTDQMMMVNGKEYMLTCEVSCTTGLRDCDAREREHRVEHKIRGYSSSVADDLFIVEVTQYF